MRVSKQTCTRIAIIGIVAVCGQWVVSDGADDWQLDRASVVVVYQIVGRPDEASSESLQDNPRVESYPVLDMSIISSPATIRRLGTLVAAERRADHNASACFYPGMALSFVAEGRVAHVLICLECRNLSGPGIAGVTGMSDGAAEEFAIVYTKLFRGVSREGAR
jgi:hypothetical protein